MNAYPPPRYVAQGIFRLLPHPIYTGFTMLCVGVSIAVVSASGLWLVSPIVALRRLRRTCQRSEEHTSELQSRGHLVCGLLLEKKKYVFFHHEVAVHSVCVQLLGTSRQLGLEYVVLSFSISSFCLRDNT